MFITCQKLNTQAKAKWFSQNDLWGLSSYKYRIKYNFILRKLENFYQNLNTR